MKTINTRDITETGDPITHEPPTPPPSSLLHLKRANLWRRSFFKLCATVRDLRPAFNLTQRTRAFFITRKRKKNRESVKVDRNKDCPYQKRTVLLCNLFAHPSFFWYIRGRENNLWPILYLHC